MFALSLGGQTCAHVCTLTHTRTHTHTHTETVKKTSTTKLSNTRNKLKSLEQDFAAYKQRKRHEVNDMRKKSQEQLNVLRNNLKQAHSEIERKQNRLQEAETRLEEAETRLQEAINPRRRYLLRQVGDKTNAEIERSQRLVKTSRKKLLDVQRHCRERKRECREEVEAVEQKCMLMVEQMQSKCDADVRAYEQSSRSVLDMMYKKQCDAKEKHKKLMESLTASTNREMQKHAKQMEEVQLYAQRNIQKAKQHAEM